MIDDDSSARTDADADESEPKAKKGSFWRELPILLAIAVVVALLVRTFALQSFWIPSGSMENTLQRGDRVLVNKVIYDFREPERGEIIVFKAPRSWRGQPDEEDFIKRVIAIGGDTVSYDAGDGRIAVNDHLLDETSYIYTNPATGEQDLASKDGYEFEVTVPNGRLWVMGDHRGSSGDSRENYIRGGGDIGRATIPVDSVVGKAFLLMWPVARWNWLTIPDTFDAVPRPARTGLPGSCQAGRAGCPRKLLGVIDDEERVPPGAVADGADDNENKPASKTKKKGSFWRELPVLLVVAVVVALLVRTFVLQSFWIPSGSMENTLRLNDYVLANKLIYDFRDPERGEIIVFEAPQSWRGAPGEEDFIKRVIAVGGDTVSYSKQDKHVRVNGQKLEESSYLYTDPDTGKQQSPSLEDQEFKVKVPEGRMWVMGDHRWASGDSRERWQRTQDARASTIPVDAVIGKAFVLVWPIDHWDGLTIPDTFDEVPEPK